jgi:hypothetical protein
MKKFKFKLLQEVEHFLQIKGVANHATIGH